MRVMENEMVRRMVWTGLVTALGALASIAVQRLATVIWVRVFDQDPPID